VESFETAGFVDDDHENDRTAAGAVTSFRWLRSGWPPRRLRRRRRRADIAASPDVTGANVGAAPLSP
jgi:hypothetical protein